MCHQKTDLNSSEFPHAVDLLEAASVHSETSLQPAVVASCIFFWLYTLVAVPVPGERQPWDWRDTSAAYVAPC